MDTSMTNIGPLFADDDALRNAKPKLVAFSGRAGSGKSVCAEYLMSQGWERVKFADPLKNMLRAFFKTVGLSDEEIERRIEGDLKETPDYCLNGVSPRRAMQTLGQEWGRDCIDSYLWVAAWEAAVESAWARGRNVVVDDCRYENEAYAIREMGGTVVMVQRPMSMTVDWTHESEQFNWQPDDYLLNVAGVDALIDKVRSFL